MPKKDDKSKIITRLKEIDLKTTALLEEKVKLNKELSKPVPEVPLNQLNLVAQLGAKEAKKKLGDGWVE